MNREDQAEALCVRMLKDNPLVAESVLGVMVEGILEGAFTYHPEVNILTSGTGDEVSFLRVVPGGFQKIK